MSNVEIWKMVESGNAFGNMTPSDLNTDYTISFHSWRDPINRDERYRDHSTCRSFYHKYLKEAPKEVACVNGYAGNTTYVSLKHLKAWCFGYFDEVIAAERAIKQSAEEKKRMEKMLAATAKISTKMPAKSSLAIELAKAGFSGEEYFSFFQNDLLVVSWTEWDTSTRSGVYCSVSTVTDYHVRRTIAYDISGTEPKRIGAGYERRLFRTTEKGVVSEHYSANAFSANIVDSKINITFGDGDTVSIELKRG